MASIPIGGDMDAALRKLKASLDQESAAFNARLEMLFKQVSQAPTDQSAAAGGSPASKGWGNSTQRTPERKDRSFSGRRRKPR